jgi:lipid A 3-O-deacylase
VTNPVVLSPARRFAATLLCALAIFFSARHLPAQAVASSDATPFHLNSGHLPFEFGALVQGGKGFTDNRDGFKFIMAGVHAGKVLTYNHGFGPIRGNFEYAVEAFPFWQSYTPKFQREMCTTPTNCTAPYTVGGTFTGASITPIILRWNFVGTRRISPWIQGAGGVLWTNHKYPAFGGPPYNPVNDGPNSDASVWNFTPQAGVGAHFFLSPRRSVDFGINAVHISSASLGDKNPGVNASIHLFLGYTWWK